MRATSTLVLFFATLANAARAAAPPPDPSLVDYVMDLVNDTLGAGIALATDVLEMLMATPRFCVDTLVWCVETARGMPDLFTSVFKGDAATLNNLASFCSETASIIFVTYASLAALNLLLAVATSVKDYFSSYMTLPTAVMGQKLPKPLLTVRDVIQKQALDRIRNFTVKSWIIPLEKQAGTPTLAGVTSTISSAISGCMVLSCVPAVLSLMRGGANKADAEAIAYTLGTALGLKYLVKISA